MPISLAIRLWSRVSIPNKDACWEWLGAKSDGYGVIWVPELKKNIKTHVVSLFLHTGRWPFPGELVLHQCPNGDNRSCVNPSHLYYGTNADNTIDVYISKHLHASKSLSRETLRKEHKDKLREKRAETLRKRQRREELWKSILG